MREPRGEPGHVENRKSAAAMFAEPVVSNINDRNASALSRVLIVGTLAAPTAVAAKEQIPRGACPDPERSDGEGS